MGSRRQKNMDRNVDSRNRGREQRDRGDQERQQYPEQSRVVQQEGMERGDRGRQDNYDRDRGGGGGRQDSAESAHYVRTAGYSAAQRQAAPSPARLNEVNVFIVSREKS